jgi:copper(I)-binding protein
MNKIRLSAIALLLTLLNINFIVFADELKPDILVEAPYVRATIPGTDITSAYMTIKNNSENKVILIGASSSVSDRIEIHQHTMNNGMMKMRQVKQLVIKENSQVTLQPMGYHLMIFKVKNILQPKDEVAITLHFKQQKDLVVAIPVQSIKQEKQIKKQHNHH